MMATCKVMVIVRRYGHSSSPWRKTWEKVDRFFGEKIKSSQVSLHLSHLSWLTLKSRRTFLSVKSAGQNAQWSAAIWSSAAVSSFERVRNTLRAEFRAPCISWIAPWIHAQLLVAVLGLHFLCLKDLPTLETQNTIATFRPDVYGRECKE